MQKENLKVYERDSSQIRGEALGIFFPENIEEVCSIIKKNKDITIRGGGSGLAGGAVPQKDFIVDLSKLDKIIELDKDKKRVIVEAGVILDDLQDFLSKYDLEFPINPSSHSICTIGGMIATNAVGTRAMKYGRTSDNVLWIDVVDYKGEMIRVSKADLSDYAGMEGITGVIVKACLKLVEKKERSFYSFSCLSYQEIIEKVKEYKKNRNVSAIELVGKEVSKLIGLDFAYNLLVEFEESGNNKESEYLYKKRDNIFPVLSSSGFHIIEDPKVILEKSKYLVDWLEEKKIPFYSHISVGIFHPCFSDKNKSLIPEMMRIVKKINGKISGEHGIGILKKGFLDEGDRKIIYSIKKRLDPVNKFNKGKVI